MSERPQGVSGESGGDARALADDMLAAFLDESPVFATLIGVRDRDALLPDLRVEAQERAASRYDAIAERAATQRDAGSPADQVTVDVVRQFGASAAERVRVGLDRIAVTDLFVAPAAGLLSIWPFITLDRPEHARDFLDRLRAVPEFLAAAADRHREGVASGWTPVARLAGNAVEHLDRYLAEPDEDPALQPAAPSGWDGAADFAAARAQVLTDVVRPAFASYRHVVREELAPLGRGDDRPGLCWLPGGAEAYAALIRHHTTTDTDAETLHRTGHDLVAGLAEEYAQLGGEVLGTSTLGEIFDRLREDASLRFTSAEEIVSTAEAAIARAETAAPQWFGRLPSRPCQVQPFPPQEAPHSPAAVYMAGTPDGARQGTYLVNTHLPAEWSRHIAEATAFHEGVPGHHFQITVAQELTELPLLRRWLPINAFEEGWALYTERLADEMGLYSSPLARLGMLSADSLRAARLVVDTGLHALGWTRQQAVDYMVANVPTGRRELEFEVDRYIADPGQALAYMVGRLEIRRLRDEAQHRLGERFDVRAFHDLVLGGGSLPMSTLAGVVERWSAG